MHRSFLFFFVTLIVVALAACTSPSSRMLRTDPLSDTSVDDTDSYAHPPELTATVDLFFQTSDESAFSDIKWSGTSFLVSSSLAEDSGMICELDSESLMLPNDCISVWYGSETLSRFGENINLLTYGGTQYLASNEYEPPYEYRGVLLARSLISGYKGRMADGATLNVTGASNGNTLTGGRFGTAAALFEDMLVVTQPGAEEAVLVGSASMLADGGSIGEFTSIMDGDPPVTGGKGSVGVELAVDEHGFGVAIEDGLLQHFAREDEDEVDSDLVADWWAKNEDERGGGLVTFDPNRDVSGTTHLSQLNTDYAVSVLLEDGSDADMELTAVDGGFVGGAAHHAYSVTEGTTEDNLWWLAWGVAKAYRESATQFGYIYIMRNDIQIIDVLLPLSAYSCRFRIVSDGAYRIGAICDGAPWGMILTVR